VNRYDSAPERLGALLAELQCPWYICGGWALDLYLNRVTREHKDIDIAVARSDQWVVREYLRRRGWRLEKVSGGTRIIIKPCLGYDLTAR
jgi:hypothetical protein